MTRERRAKTPSSAETDRLERRQIADKKAQGRGESGLRDRRQRARDDIDAIRQDDIATVPPPPQRHDAANYVPRGYRDEKIKGHTYLMQPSALEELDSAALRSARKLSAQLATLTAHRKLAELRQAMATLSGLLDKRPPPLPADRWRGMLERCLEMTARDRAEERLRMARGEENETAPRTGAQILEVMEQRGAPPPAWVTAPVVDTMIPCVGLSGGGPGGKKTARNLIAAAERLEKAGKLPRSRLTETRRR